jgi:hypothetical protein
VLCYLFLLVGIGDSAVCKRFFPARCGLVGLWFWVKGSLGCGLTGTGVGIERETGKAGVVDCRFLALSCLLSRCGIFDYC